MEIGVTTGAGSTTKARRRTLVCLSLQYYTVDCAGWPGRGDRGHAETLLYWAGCAGQHRLGIPDGALQPLARLENASQIGCKPEHRFGSPAQLVRGFTLSDLLDKPCRGHRCLPFPLAHAFISIAHTVQYSSFSACYSHVCAAQTSMLLEAFDTFVWGAN